MALSQRACSGEAIDTICLCVFEKGRHSIMLAPLVTPLSAVFTIAAGNYICSLHVLSSECFKCICDLWQFLFLYIACCAVLCFAMLCWGIQTSAGSLPRSTVLCHLVMQ